MSYQSIPEWDSMTHASLMVAIEKTYGCKIDDTAMMALTTIGTIVHFVEHGTTTQVPPSISQR